MKQTGTYNSAFGADRFGFQGLAAVHWNLQAPLLYGHAIRRSEAEVAAGGALVADTGVHTGRSPKDKFIVRDDRTEKAVWWDNNGAISPAQFETLLADFLAQVPREDDNVVGPGLDKAFRRIDRNMGAGQEQALLDRAPVDGVREQVGADPAEVQERVALPRCPVACDPLAFPPAAPCLPERACVVRRAPEARLLVREELSVCAALVSVGCELEDCPAPPPLLPPPFGAFSSAEPRIA